MKSFVAGKPVVATVSLVDEDGVHLPATAVQYRILDEAGQEVLARTNLAGFVADSETAEISVTDVQNELTADMPFGARMIELFVTTPAGEEVVVHTYGLVSETPLVVPDNSFQVMSQAQHTAMTMSDLTGWAAASNNAKMTALIEARNRIAQLQFRYDFGTQNTVEPQFAVGDINELTAEEFDGLPADFLDALRKAQLAEANVILGGDPVEDIRREGLMSKTVGESSQMYRPGKPLQLPVCARAMRCLGKYVSWRRQITRT